MLHHGFEPWRLNLIEHLSPDFEQTMTISIIRDQSGTMRHHVHIGKHETDSLMIDQRMTKTRARARVV